MSNGGYIMIDFSGLSLSSTESQTIPGLYFSLDTAIKTKKPVIGYNLTYNDNLIFCRNMNIAKNENAIVCTTDTLTITVTANDTAIVSETTSGTNDYEDLDNLPKINSVEIKGNVSLAALGVASTADIAALQPVDSVTDGETKAVTSNAVYDYINDRLLVENVAFENATITSGGHNTFKKNVVKENYDFIGIVGIGITNIDLQPVEWGSEQSATVAYCSCKNTGNGSITAHPIVKCLYLKSN